MFATDAGGGKNSLERWQNYTSTISKNAPPDSVGRWVHLLSDLDSNATKNILSANAREMFLKEKRVTYNYPVTSNGQCYPISVNSSSSISAPTINQSTRAITFTLAGSTETTGNATIIVPTALIGKNFTVFVDSQSVKPKTTSSSADTTITLDYTGGIKSIVISRSGNP